MSGQNRVQQPDLTADCVGNLQLQNQSVNINKLKIQDSGDSSSINATTLPMAPSTIHPTISEAIAAIPAGASSLILTTITTTGTSATYALVFSVNTSVIYWLYVNGEYQNVNVDYSIVGGNSIVFNYIPEINQTIQLISQHI